jgi:hypothetical protein
MLIVIEHYLDEYMDMARKNGFDFKPFPCENFYHENSKSQGFRCEVNGYEVVLIRSGYGLNYSLAVVDYLSYLNYKREQHLLDGLEDSAFFIACYSPSEYIQSKYKIGQIVAPNLIHHLESQRTYAADSRYKNLVYYQRAIASSKADQLWGRLGNAYDSWYHGWENFEKEVAELNSIELSDYSCSYGVHAAEMSNLKAQAIGFVREVYTTEGHTAITPEQKVDAYEEIFNEIYQWIHSYLPPNYGL